MSITSHNTQAAKAFVTFFRNAGMPDNGIAALMSNIDKESAFYSNNLQNSANTSLKITDDEYVRQVDAGERNFVDNKGFGLIQWTSSGRKSGLYSLAKSYNKSVSDLQVQFLYMWNELNNNSTYKSKVLKYLMDPKQSIDTCTRKAMVYYVAPANQTESNKKNRVANAEEFYDLYLKDEEPINTRNAVVSNAYKYIGTTFDKDKNIIFVTEYYGAPKNYKVAYCAIFVWYVFKLCGLSDLIYGGKKFASCTKTLNYFRTNMPDAVHTDISRCKPGDLVFYQFDKDSNADHMGIFKYAKSNTEFYAIEGNTTKKSGSGSESNGGYVEEKLRNIKKVMAFVSLDIPEGNDCPFVKPDKTVSKGTKGESAKWVQWQLNRHNYICSIDGSFGKDSQAKTMAFQCDNALEVDGKVGKMTRAKLEA